MIRSEMIDALAYTVLREMNDVYGDESADKATVDEIFNNEEDYETFCDFLDDFSCANFCVCFFTDYSAH